MNFCKVRLGKTTSSPRLRNLRGHSRALGSRIVARECDDREVVGLRSLMDDLGRLEIVVADARNASLTFSSEDPVTDWQRVADVTQTRAFSGTDASAATMVAAGLNGYCSFALFGVAEVTNVR